MRADLALAYACALAAAILVGVAVHAFLAAHRARAARAETDELADRASAGDLPVQAVRQGVALGAIALFFLGAVPMAGKPGALLFFLALCVAGALALPGIILRALAGRRRDLLRAELPDALDMLANSLRAGLTLPQALARNLSRFPPRIGAEFARILYDTRLGYALGDAFENFGRRLPIAEVSLVVIASKIGVSHGGNLAESYTMLSALIRDNLAFEAELRAMTTEGRMQAIVMSCLPFALLLILLLVRREVVLPLFRTGAGLATLLVMAAMQAVAYLWIRKIVEVRV